MSLRSLTLFTLCVVSALLTGCSGGGSEINLAPVSGKVTNDGVGVPGVLVEFFPEDGRASTATTDEEGNFTLVYSDLDGAVVGMGRFQLTEGMASTAPAATDSTDVMMPPMQGPPEIISVTGTFEVQEDAENIFTFELNEFRKKKGRS